MSAFGHGYADWFSIFSQSCTSECRLWVVSPGLASNCHGTRGPHGPIPHAAIGCYSTTYLADPRPISRSEALSSLFRVSISSDAARSPVCLPFIFTHRDYLVCPPRRLLHSCCCLVHRTDQLRFSICLGDKIHSLGDYPSVAHTKLKPVLPISVAEDFVTHDKCKENVHKHAPIVFHRFECFSLAK